MCHLQGPLWKPLELMRGAILSTSRIDSSLGPTYKMMKDSRMNGVCSLTNSDNIAVFLVQFIIVEILLSTDRNICNVKFGEFTKEWTRIFSQGVPGRDSVDKDGGDESRPEKTEHLHCCQDSTTSMGNIEACQVCWDSQEQNEEPVRPTCLCLFEDEMHKL